MKTALNIDISYDQVLALVMQLPTQQKIQLSKELEKEGIGSSLTALLQTFRTKELRLNTINAEVEIGIQKTYTDKSGKK